MLPEPKNTVTATTKSLIPNVLRQVPNTMKKSLPTPRIAKPSNKKATNGLSIDYSDEDSDNDESTDFFSFNKKHDISVEEAPLDIEIPIPTKRAKMSPESKVRSFFKDIPAGNDVEMEIDEVSNNVMPMDSYNGPEESTSAANELELDEEAVSLYFKYSLTFFFIVAQYVTSLR